MSVQLPRGPVVVQEVPVECVPAGGADTTDGAGERVVCFVAGRVHEKHWHASEGEGTSALEELKRKRKRHVTEKMCETERCKILAFIHVVSIVTKCLYLHRLW